MSGGLVCPVAAGVVDQQSGRKRCERDVRQGKEKARRGAKEAAWPRVGVVCWQVGGDGRGRRVAARRRRHFARPSLAQPTHGSSRTHPANEARHVRRQEHKRRGHAGEASKASASRRMIRQLLCAPRLASHAPTSTCPHISSRQPTLFMREPSTSAPCARTGANSTASRHVSAAVSGKLLPGVLAYTRCVCTARSLRTHTRQAMSWRGVTRLRE